MSLSRDFGKGFEQSGHRMGSQDLLRLDKGYWGSQLRHELDGNGIQLDAKGGANHELRESVCRHHCVDGEWRVVKLLLGRVAAADRDLHILLVKVIKDSMSGCAS